MAIASYTSSLSQLDIGTSLAFYIKCYGGSLMVQLAALGSLCKLARMPCETRVDLLLFGSLLNE